jgi:hypothetical protein
VLYTIHAELIPHRKNLIWTVEWIHADRRRSVCTVSERTPIEQAYRSLIREQLPNPSKKRKRTAKESKSIEQATPITAGEGRIEHVSVSDEIKHPGVEADGEEAQPTPSGRRGARENDEPAPGGPKPDADVEDALHPSASVHVPVSESIPTRYRYFLLRPRTNTSRHVLIPISPSTTLNECLRGRTVLEFPTIYVLTDAPDALPEVYMLEEEYIKQENEDQKEFEALMKDVKPEDLRAMISANGGADADEEVDSAKILDVLKQDLGAAL